MNVIPNSFNSSAVALHETTTNSNNTVNVVSTKQQKDNRSLLQCVVCEEALNEAHNADPHSLPSYQMLAVRPSIGLPAGPFFPVLESLTHTSAVRVPCCHFCSKSLLDQWNEYESKNVLIKNRVYNLSVKKPQTNLNRVAVFTDSSVSAVNMKASNARVLPHATNNGNPLSNKEANNSLQDEVLDLSMSSTAVNSKQSPQILAQSLVNQSSFSNLNKITGTRPRTASSSSSDIVTATISPFFNSSMTNLIKVTSNSVPLTLKTYQPVESNNSSSPISIRKPVFNCSLCDEPCHQLLSIMIRPMGNCPYFLTLIPYIKSSLIDASGKIGTCESCHRQLIQQWDSYQKSNKPINERHYQLVRSSKPNTVLSFPFISDSAANTNSNNSRTHIPIIVQPTTPATSSVLNKATFVCVVCGKDLLLSASNPMTNAMHTAFSLLTENDTSGATTIKKLVIPGAQEINLLPFLSPNINTLQQHQIQLLHDAGRVLVCYICFESIASRCTSSSNCIVTTNNLPNTNNNNTNNCTNNSDQVVLLKPTNTSNRSSQDTINGVVQKSTSSHEIGNNNEIPISDLLCLACGHNKAQYLVETKENSSKSPFFPFLRDPNEPNGRARICGACHLMLETQWDAFEAAYVSYNQRNYRLPSSISQSNIILSKRTFSVTSPSPTLNLTSTNHSRTNGQPTPPPLKIQISSPSIQSNSSSQTVNNSSHSSDHLLLTTVSNSTQSNTILSHQPAEATTMSSTSAVTDDERIFKLINEFLSNLGGPHSVLSGNCTVCGENSPVGKTYQVFSSSRKILLSPELGVYPYFPMLKNTKKSTKNLLESAHLVCTFCYHSLIAQWAAYHLSTYPEDRDLNNRIYNCRDFICYVCGVTTYRTLVRSITIKEFPFLLEHKRPPGALSLCKGESVVTCLNCFETLTHQWIENERMKVPLEMRKYNWMAVPPPPLSKSENDTKNPMHSDIQRTVLSCHSNNSVFPSTNPHNGLVSATSKANFTSMTPIEIRSSTVTVAPPVVFNPSHTLAPLVAAAMAATPVTTKQQEVVKCNESIVVNTPTANSFADVLRHLARQQSINMQNKIDPNVQRAQPIVNHLNSSTNHVSNINSLTSNNSINLTTLASVAALAGSHRNAPPNSDAYPPSGANNTFSSNMSIANNTNVHYGVDTVNSDNVPHLNFLNHNSTLVRDDSELKSHNTHNDSQKKNFNVKQEFEENSVFNEQYEKCLSKVNVEELKLRRKRLARLARIKSNSQSGENVSDMSDDELAEIGIEMESTSSSEVDNINTGYTNGSESLLNFIDSVIPVLELDTNPEKLEFMSKLGLITQPAKRQLEFDRYIRRKSSRKLCSASFQLDLFEENDVLLNDPSREEFPSKPHFCPSDIMPTSKILNAHHGTSLTDSNNITDKESYMKALGLFPSSVDVQLETELTWLAVIQNRQSRKKRRIVCVGKTYNNLSDKVLNTWLPQLSSSLSSSKTCIMSDLIDQFGEWVPLNDPNKAVIVQTSEIAPSSTMIKQEDDECASHTDTHRTIRGTSCLETTVPNVAQTDNQINNNTNSSQITIQPSNKILNTKQFAQEFHELVLLETQKQMSKQNNCTATDLCSSASAQHTIIYSDHLKPHPDVAHQTGVDQNGPITASTGVTFQEKILRDQIFKIQQLIADNDRESQYLNEKKNEIVESLRKLSDERSSYQIELERLTHCLDQINAPNN